MLRTDEKLRNLLDTALNAAIVLNDLDLCTVIFKFSMENTFVLKLNEDVLDLLTTECLNSSKPDFSFIRFIISNKIPIIVKKKIFTYEDDDILQYEENYNGTNSCCTKI